MRMHNATLRPGIRYMQLDARDMKLPDKSFDIVIDKSTIDALSCAGWKSVSRYSSEVHRVLKDCGIFLCVSLHKPKEIKSRIEETGKNGHQWRVKVLEADRGGGKDKIFMYTCVK